VCSDCRHIRVVAGVHQHPHAWQAQHMPVKGGNAYAVIILEVLMK
jgi:hypothetical protein